MLLALLPFAGLGWFSVQALERAADRVDAAAEIESIAPEVISLAALDSHLSTENYWSTAIASTQALGLPTDFIASFIGIDMVQELEQAKALVDAALDDPALEAASDQLQRARGLVEGGGATTTAIGQAYEDVADALAAPVRARIDDLTRLSSDVPDSYELSRSTQALATALDARSMSSGVAFGYFAARYPGAAVEADPALNLVRWTTLYDDAASELDLLLAADSVASEVWERVKADPDVVELVTRARGFNTAAVVDSGTATATSTLMPGNFGSGR